MSLLSFPSTGSFHKCLAGYEVNSHLETQRNSSLTSLASKWENKCSTAARVYSQRIKGNPGIFIVSIFSAELLLLPVRMVGDSEFILDTENYII